jgi:hypothetical protein
MSVDLNSVPITHPAEKQALADLLTRLEATDVSEVTQQQIDIARDEVARDMGWSIPQPDPHVPGQRHERASVAAHNAARTDGRANRGR